MAQKETHILIATGGYLNDEIKMEKIIVDENNMDEDFDDFGEYVDYTLEEAAAVYEQGFSQVLIITGSQLSNLLGELSKINKL